MPESLTRSLRLRAALAVPAAAALLVVSGVRSEAPQQEPGPVTLVGWWDNPTPGNAYLTTATRQYTIAEQGQGGAEGDWPEFARGRMVRTNGSHGYGCARLQVVLNGEQVVRILHAQSLPLTACRSSAALRKAEPPR